MSPSLTPSVRLRVVLLAGELAPPLSVRITDREPIAALVDRRLIKVVMVMVVMLPLSLLRNISRLEKVTSSRHLLNIARHYIIAYRYTSYQLQFSALAIVFITIIVSVTVYEATQLFCAV